MICPHCQKPIPRKITPKQKADVLKLLDQGYSTRDIEKLVGVGSSSVSRINKERKNEKSKN